MKLKGYMVEVEWDGHTLRARGTTKPGRVALRGQDHDKGDLVLTRDQFEVEKFSKGNPLINGNLVLRAEDGARYQLHFRRKDNSDFTALAHELGAVLT